MDFLWVQQWLETSASFGWKQLSSLC